MMTLSGLVKYEMELEYFNSVEKNNKTRYGFLKPILRGRSMGFVSAVTDYP
jgi:hypothetical protein